MAISTCVSLRTGPEHPHPLHAPLGPDKVNGFRAGELARLRQLVGGRERMSAPEKLLNMLGRTGAHGGPTLRWERACFSGCG